MRYQIVKNDLKMKNIVENEYVCKAALRMPLSGGYR